MEKLPGITIIGTGAVGTALGLALHQKGFRICSLVNRTISDMEKLAEITVSEEFKKTPSELKQFGEVIFLCVPDDQILEVSQDLARLNLSENTVIHTSGVHSAEILSALREKGAETGSAHPLQTFANADAGVFENIWVSLNGSNASNKIAGEIFSKLGAKTLIVDDEQKTKLHIAAVMVCNYMVSLVKAADEIAGISEPSIQEIMMPLMRQTLQNIAEKNLPDALTGPVKRGDTGTVEKHLSVLKENEQAQNLYRQLGHYAVNVAEQSGLEKQAVALMRDLFLT